MDNLTHSLFGLTLARTPLARAGRGTTFALLLASNAPDIDIVAVAGGTANYLRWHRGPTHGLLGIVGLALASAAIAWLGTRWWDRNGSAPRASLLQLWGISVVGVACHVLMDLPTSYGTRVLSPVAWTWFAKDWMPIVDVYLWAILGSGLFFGRLRAGSGRTGGRARNAAIALVLMLVNYGVRASAHHQALALAPRMFGAQLPPPCDDAVQPSGWIDRWPRISLLSPRDQSARRCLVEIAAIPSFLSPFKWRLIAQLSNAYEIRDVDVLQAAPTSDVRLVGLRYPNQWTPAVAQAAQSSIAQTFLGFSRFPAARSSLDAQGNATVRWSDMRFTMNPLGDPRRQGGTLFDATIRLAPDGTVVAQRLGP